MTPAILAQREITMQAEVLKALNVLKKIESGHITRMRRKDKTTMHAGSRTMTMAEAKAMAGDAAVRLGAVLHAFTVTAPKPEDWLTFETEFISVHLEPTDMQGCPAEDCADCHAPTRYWMQDHHTPLCPSCCKLRNEKRGFNAIGKQK